MNILDNYGEVLLQQHEGKRQIASVLAESARVLVQRLAKLLSPCFGRTSS
jgi:hypothetical protein